MALFNDWQLFFGNIWPEVFKTLGRTRRGGCQALSKVFLSLFLDVSTYAPEVSVAVWLSLTSILRQV